MVTSTRRRATYADLEAAPPDRVAEIVDGELLLRPRPRLRHAAAAAALGEELGPPFRRGRGGPGGWLFLDEPELHFGPADALDVLVPDMAGWRRERFANLDGDTAGIDVVPDWVCEVLSPSTAGIDRVRKAGIYRREGVAHVWLIDPAERTLEVLRLEVGRYVVADAAVGEVKVRAEPFAAIELDLALLWSP